MVKAYRKGADYERKIINEARAEGKLAFRSAGSHSPIDCFICDSKTKRITLIQAKKGGKAISESQKKAISKELNYLNDEYQVAFEIWHKP